MSSGLDLLEKRIEQLEIEVATWRKRANEAADRSVQLQIHNNRLTSALETIKHTGYAGDSWVDVATRALRSNAELRGAQRPA